MAKKDEAPKETTTEQPEAEAPPPSRIGDGKAWGAAVVFESDDLKLPRIDLMQGSSQLVKDGKATVGEFRESSSGEILGTKDNGPSLIVIHQTKDLITELSTKIAENKFQKTRQRPVPLDPKNKALPRFEELPNSGSVKRWPRYNFYALVVDDRFYTRLPVVFRCEVTNWTVGQELMTFFGNMAKQGQPSAAVVIKLKTIARANDSGSWLGLAFESVRPATEKELETAYTWWTTITAESASVSVDDSGEDAPAAESAREPAPQSAPKEQAVHQF